MSIYYLIRFDESNNSITLRLRNVCKKQKALMRINILSKMKETRAAHCICQKTSLQLVRL